jgi:hypothetical protein
MKKSITFFTHIFFGALLSAQAQQPVISGVYPHLAQYNDEGECGTGAVVAWAGRLWTISYGPHQPYGSSDKLYEIRNDLSRVVRAESVGGTHANRMIHKESRQLFIGYHVIDDQGRIRTIEPNRMPGRLTGMARSLTDPANKILYATMEEGFYEVDVHTLEVKMLFKDGNQMRKEGAQTHESPLLPGVHGKGFYSGQGVYVYSNNGEAGARARVDPTIEAGSLCEWDGKTWKVVRRNQFVEVTGPGGIYGNSNPDTDPIWATGWDHRSALLGVRAKGGWTFYRLPKASNSYDGAHGWNTEWPRIRNIGTSQSPDFVMTLHGLFWRFPSAFKPGNTGGIRPRSSYLKVVGDLERWNDRLVLGCDDATKSEFLSNRADKAGIPGAGQSHSNLWFTAPEMLDRNAPIDAVGSLWLRDTVRAGVASEPFLFAGWSQRTAWLRNHANARQTLLIQFDSAGNGQWKTAQTITLNPQSSRSVSFDAGNRSEWIRVVAERAGVVSVSMAYADPKNKGQRSPALFEGLASVKGTAPQGAVMYALPSSRKLGLLSTEGTYYEMDSTLRIVPVSGSPNQQLLKEKISIPMPLIRIDGTSFLVTDNRGRRWRLPVTDTLQSVRMMQRQTRVVREVVTERDLLHCGGTFFELPADNADGFAKVKPIASHSFAIHDIASYRGMLLMSGADPLSKTSNAHLLRSSDGRIALWAGVVDDLWKLGRPVGKGAPWSMTRVQSGDSSDAYLFGGYDRRRLEIVNHGVTPLTVRVQVDATGDGVWFDGQSFKINAGQRLQHLFPADLRGKWIRFRAESAGQVSTMLTYE